MHFYMHLLSKRLRAIAQGPSTPFSIPFFTQHLSEEPHRGAYSYLHHAFSGPSLIERSGEGQTSVVVRVYDHKATSSKARPGAQTILTGG